MNIHSRLSIDIDGDAVEELKAATEKAFAECTAELTGRFDDAVSGNYWPWPDKTPRWGGARDLETASENWNTWLTGSGLGKKPKAVAGSPRSIVDSGDLKQSRDFSLNRRGLKAFWNWSQDYAAAVHEGAFINPFGNTKKVIQIPARPWTEAVLVGGTGAVGIDVYDIEKEIAKRITQLAN